MTPGSIIRRGKYEYRVCRVHDDGSVTVYGPTNNDPNGRRMTRTFRADDVREVVAK